MQTREKTTQIKIKENNKEEERTMRNKKGISLIVLVITIIVMIILAAAVIISLSNSGVINRANQAVNATNLAEVQHLASLAWSEAYLENMSNKNLTEEQRAANIKAAVEAAFTANNLNAADYNLTYGAGGVTVATKQPTTTLGSLITNPGIDYGKKVDYEANGVTDWKVFYHTEDYVYLIASEKLEHEKVPTSLVQDTGATSVAAPSTLADGTVKQVGMVFWSGEPTSVGNVQNSSMWMAEWTNYTETTNVRRIAHFLDETHWEAFKNTADYGDNVVGAIGTPTAEMFIASWNAKLEATNNTTKYNKKFALQPVEGKGYKLMDATTGEAAGAELSTEDDLYIWGKYSNAAVWLASPGATGTNYIMYVNYNVVKGEFSEHTMNGGLRPVVCLKASTPAVATENGYSLVI